MIQHDPTDAEVEAWLASRPPRIQALARKHPPGSWWFLTTDAKPYTALYRPYGYAEDGTLQLVRFGIGTGQPMWRVLGIKPKDLQPAPALEAVRGRLSARDLDRLRILNLEQMARLQDATLRRRKE